MAKNYHFSSLLFLFALVALSLAQSSDLERLNITQANTTLVRSLLNYGLNGVLYSVAGEGQIYQRRDFSLGDVYSVYREVLPQTTNYYFWVRLFLRRNTRVYVDTNFTVQYRPSNRSRRLLDFDYDIDFHENRTEGRAYRRIRRSQYNDPVVQKLLAFGNAFVVEQAKNRSQVPAGATFDVDRIESIHNRTAGTSIFYSFEVVLRNDTNNQVIEADYIIQYLPASGRAAVLESDFDVSDDQDRDDQYDRSDDNYGYYGYYRDRDYHDDDHHHDDNDRDDDYDDDRRDYDDDQNDRDDCRDGDCDYDDDNHNDNDNNNDDNDFSDYLGRRPQRN